MNGSHFIFRWRRLTGPDRASSKVNVAHVWGGTGRLERPDLDFRVETDVRPARAAKRRSTKERPARCGGRLSLCLGNRERRGEGNGIMGLKKSGGNQRGAAGFVVRDRTVYVAGWLLGRSETLVFPCGFKPVCKSAPWRFSKSCSMK